MGACSTAARPSPGTGRGALSPASPAQCNQMPISSQTFPSSSAAEREPGKSVLPQLSPRLQQLSTLSLRAKLTSHPAAPWAPFLISPIISQVLQLQKAGICTLLKPCRNPALYVRHQQLHQGQQRGHLHPRRGYATSRISWHRQLHRCPPRKLWRRVVSLQRCLRYQNVRGARSRHEIRNSQPTPAPRGKTSTADTAVWLPRKEWAGEPGHGHCTSPSPPLRCLLLPARCWEPTGSAGAGAALPPTGVLTPRLLSAPGGFEGPHLPGPGRCHLLGEHMGAGKLQEGGTGGVGETSRPRSAPCEDSPWHCQAGTALPQKYHVWSRWRWQLQGRVTGNRRAPRLFSAGEGTQEQPHRDAQQPRAGPG